jgi:dTDP-4-dehydrorhamnose reductase
VKILLLGADGQLGYELHRTCAPLGDILPYTYTGKLSGRQACGQVDFGVVGAVDALVREHKPSIVLNAVAHTAVDRAEDEPALSQRINAEAVGELAQACRRIDATLVHYSTDYVFDGKSKRPLREDDATGPINVYGSSKLAGEEAIRASGARHRILRTAWVYGARGQNFLRTALRLAAEREELRIVNDQVGSPTPARWLAAMTALSLVKRPEAEGTWHVVADGECSWHEFAKAIYGDALVAGLIARAPKLIGIPSSEYPTKARRPTYSRLDTGKFERDFGLRLSDWRVGLREVIGEIAEAKSA